MFIFTHKVTRKGIAIIVVIAGLLLCAIIVLVAELKNSKDYGMAETEADRIAFIRSFGWETEDVEPDVSEITIPREFDEVYLNYNLIQKAQGLDLWDFIGCKVMRYTYRIANYPTGEEDVCITLLVYNGYVIGGDVKSPRIDGFMHGFQYRG